MESIDQSMVYFKCSVCDLLFQADPYFFPVICPQCGSEETFRT